MPHGNTLKLLQYQHSRCIHKRGNSLIFQTSISLEEKAQTLSAFEISKDMFHCLPMKIRWAVHIPTQLRHHILQILKPECLLGLQGLVIHSSQILSHNNNLIQINSRIAQHWNTQVRLDCPFSNRHGTPDWPQIPVGTPCGIYFY